MPAKKPPLVLSISGSDPSGGAGIEADLKTFQRHGVYGMALPTLLTVQNTRGVRKVRHLDPGFLEEQWNALFDDLRPDAIKVGALGTRAMVLRLARLLASPAAAGIPVVLDPVLGATAGSGLLERSAIPDLIRRVFPLCRVVTPNAPEFETLFGRHVKGDAAIALKALGTLPYAVLLKGGHLRAATTIKHSDDGLWDAGKFTRLPGRRLKARNTHGTGCVLASALAARLALGETLPAACRGAKAFVRKAIATAPDLGHGRGPLNLL